MERFVSNSPAETEAWAERFAEKLSPGSVLALIGELGAGKTVVARGIGRGLDVTEQIVSPTFNYVLEYSGRLPLFHADLYRIDNADTFLAMGLDEYFDRGGVFLIEWAERIDSLLPETALMLNLAEGESATERILTASSRT